MNPKLQAAIRLTTISLACATAALAGALVMETALTEPAYHHWLTTIYPATESDYFGQAIFSGCANYTLPRGQQAQVNFLPNTTTNSSTYVAQVEQIAYEPQTAQGFLIDVEGWGASNQPTTLTFGGDGAPVNFCVSGALYVGYQVTLTWTTGVLP